MRLKEETTVKYAFVAYRLPNNLSLKVFKMNGMFSRLFFSPQGKVSNPMVGQIVTLHVTFQFCDQFASNKDMISPQG